MLVILTSLLIEALLAHQLTSLERLSLPGALVESFTAIGGSQPQGPWAPQLSAASRLAGGLGLFVMTVEICRRSDEAADSSLRLLTLGAAAVATLNVCRFVEIVVRRGGDLLPTAMEFHRTVRISSTIADVNAAGAMFALVLPRGGGAVPATGTAHRRRVGPGSPRRGTLADRVAGSDGRRRRRAGGIHHHGGLPAVDAPASGRGSRSARRDAGRPGGLVSAWRGTRRSQRRVADPEIPGGGQLQDGARVARLRRRDRQVPHRVDAFCALGVAALLPRRERAQSGAAIPGRTGPAWGRALSGPPRVQSRDGRAALGDPTRHRRGSTPSSSGCWAGCWPAS